MMNFIDTRYRSSNVAFVGYCRDCQKMVIGFIHSPQYIYVYKDVPEAHFDNIADASSVGEYYSRNIKGDNYASFKLTVEPCTSHNKIRKLVGCFCDNSTKDKEVQLGETRITLDLTDKEIDEIRSNKVNSTVLQIKITNAIIDAMKAKK